jgi:ABC-type polysaccharide/polyol phosphate export permease
MHKTEYDSAAGGNPVFAELAELARSRELLRLMVVHGIRARYKKSALGVVWTLLGPLLTVAVLSFAFSEVFRKSTPNYALFVLTGLVFWNFFSQTTTASLATFAWGGGLLKKVYIPRTAYAIAAVGAGLVNLLITLIPIAVLAIATRHPLNETVLFLPVAMLVTVAFVLGTSLLMSTLVAFFTDVAHVYQIAMQLMFYLTPVMYPKSALPPHLEKYLVLNPLNDLIELFRAPLYDGALPDTMTIGASFAWAVGTLGLGWWTFTRNADELVYRI